MSRGCKFIVAHLRDRNRQFPFPTKHFPVTQMPEGKGQRKQQEQQDARTPETYFFIFKNRHDYYSLLKKSKP